VGPDWKGQLPAGVKAVAPAQTNWIIVLLRILIDGKEDEPAVHKLQDQISIVPLSRYEGKAAAASKYFPAAVQPAGRSAGGLEEHQPRACRGSDAAFEHNWRRLTRRSGSGRDWMSRR